MSVEIPNEHNFNEDEDEAWLYGENTAKQSKSDELSETNDEQTDVQTVVVEKDEVENVEQEEIPKIFQNESQHEKNEEDEIVENVENEIRNEVDEDEDEDEESDEDDDGVNIVISDIKNITTQATAGVNRVKTAAGSTTIIPSTTIQAAKPTAPAQTKGIDLETPGLINGVPTDQYDLAILKDDEKPWLQPGADITDYFNYGFTEETWIAYCLKQKRLRSENNILKSSIQMMQSQTGVIGTTVNGPNVNGSSLIAINTQQNSINQVVAGSGQGPANQPNFNPNIMPPPQQMNFSKPPQFHPRFPPPGQAGPQSFQNRMGDQLYDNMPPPHIPDFSAPPPGWNPSTGPGGQQGMMPRMPQMPSQRMPNMPISGQQQPFNAPFQYGPQHGMHERHPPGMPPHFYPQFNRGSGQMMPQGAHSDGQHRPSRSPTPSRKSPLKSPNQQQPSDRYSKDSEKYKSRDYSSRDYDKDHRRSPSPSRRHRRDHDRRDYDRRDRDRDRDRDRERGRSREKSRDRSRDRSRSRERDDKYKRSRHRSDDDDYRSSSKSHKRSKKSSRKDRDSHERESSNNPSQNQENSDVKHD